ncbi:MAG TPA: glucose-6-phosphate dehydrogenase assembly protein OpcA [Pyrinomonadaceae bacterium]|nr:glucose-6-phosphate dehydrogenase assembly protein OpcA [Pyrinomonadaceae bacterium]
MTEFEKTFSVAVVERQLTELWAQTTADIDDEEKTVWRSRVANLLMFLSNEDALSEVSEWIESLTAAHPGRALLIMAARDAKDSDIEVSVKSLCQTDKRTGARRLCGEQITLTAYGKFVVELPSAALPLLVSDLLTFLYWRDDVNTADEVFQKLLGAADRLVIDSAEFREPTRELTHINEVFQLAAQRNVGISDLNWERLTLWRALLADFYDVPEYQTSLDRVESVQVDYVGFESPNESLPPQALLFVGWLATRLGWKLQATNRGHSFKFTAADDRTVSVELKGVTVSTRKPGRLARIEIKSEDASFLVALGEDNTHILAEARIGSKVKRGRVLPVRNRSLAQLLAREMEILGNDRVYQEAVAMAARMIKQ